MHTKIKRDIIALAEQNPNEEVCGLIYAANGQPAVFPCRNEAADPVHDFEISHESYLGCLERGRPIAVYHSHPHGPAAFSVGRPDHPEELGDLEYAEEIALPSYLYSLPTKQWLEYIPKSYVVPLEQREFMWGFEDCYATVRHYYRQKFSIYLSDYDRDDSFGDTDSNVIAENFEREGFDARVSGEIKIHDVLVFRSKRALPQHFGVYVGNGRVLWHLLNRLSHIDPLTGDWLGRLKYVLRHRSMS